MKVHLIRLVIALTVVFGLAGCGSDQDTGTGTDTVMPDVTGQRLDVALSDIKTAGVDEEVEVLGGGMLGVIDESNWQVCDQSPSAGQAVTAAPRLTVDRSCDDDSPEPTAAPASAPPNSQPSETSTQAAEPEESDPAPTAPAPSTTSQPSEAPTPKPEPEESAPAPTSPQAEVSLTVETNEDLAALLAGSDSAYDMIERFAAMYKGQVIEFDGNIASMSNHGDNETRYDLLILAGDYSESSATGPYFQFRDVNTTFDLHLTGSNIPDFIGQGDNLHIIARVEEYERDSGLFLLEPISTEVR